MVVVEKAFAFVTSQERLLVFRNAASARAPNAMPRMAHEIRSRWTYFGSR
jgi:hypothetical protein